MSTTVDPAVRLKYLCGANQRVLPEDTDPRRSFVYIDISAVSQGAVNLPSEDVTFAEAPSRARRLAKAGDIVVSTVRTYLRAIASVPNTDRGLVFSTGFAVLHPSSGTDSRWLAYALQSDAFVDQVIANSDGISYPAISASRLMSLTLPVHTLGEQHAIAEFLDRETARIDALIEEQQRLIELLRERRTALADSLIWAGLSRDVEVEPTGLDSVPAAPSHWRRLRNRNIFRERAEISHTGDEELLTVSHLTGVTPRSQKNVTMFEAETREGYRIVRPGDLCINTMWAWMGAAGVSNEEGIVSPAYGVYEPLPSTPYVRRFFDYLIRTTQYVTEMTRQSRGITSSRLRLYPADFLRLPVVVPPFDEQAAIATYLDEQTGKINWLIAETERFMELARERRAVLITEAVTGQIDVRAMVGA